MLYYGKKLVIFMISVGLLSLVTSYVSRLAPGDPLFSYYGERVEKMSPEEREWAEEKLGLNDKISVQYSRWIHQVFHGNFGRSYKYKMDVLDVLKSRLGNTLRYWLFDYICRCIAAWSHMCMERRRMAG